MKILDTGIKLYEILITAGCGDRVFPVVAETSTEFPFIIYRRVSTEIGKTKDYTCASEYDVSIVSDSYGSAMDIANTAFSLLHYRINDGLFSTVLNIEEDYIDGFIINLTIKVEI